MIQVALGHNNIPQMLPLVVSLHEGSPLTYTTRVASDGRLYNVGGASYTLMAEALNLDEVEALLNQFGLSTYTPSAYVTVELPDATKTYTPFNGVASFSFQASWRGWYEGFEIRLTNLVEIV